MEVCPVDEGRVKEQWWLDHAVGAVNQKKAYITDEQREEYDIVYKKAHRDAHNANSKAYHKANRDAIRAQHKAHYEANRDAIRAHQKAYKEAKCAKILWDGSGFDLMSF